jgi:excisionase family DNA binding protein
MTVQLDDEVMTLEEVAGFLKIGEQTVYNLTRDAEIPSRKIGREWRYLKSEVLEYVKNTRESKEGVVQLDGFGGEYKQEDGQTLVALWLPMTLEQKEAQIKKAMNESTTVSKLVLEFLDKWMKNKK